MFFYRRTRAVLVIILSLLITGCAGIYSPRIDAGKLAQPGAKDVSEVVGESIVVRQELNSRIQDLSDFEFWSGLAILGVGVAGATVGIFDLNTDALIGLSVGGTALFAGRNYIPIQSRKQAYQEGILAIDCAVASANQIAGPQVGNIISAVNVSNIGVKSEEVATLTSSASSVSSVGNNAAARLAGIEASEIPAANSDVEQELANAVREVIRSNAKAPESLRVAILGIVDAVNSRITQESFDVQALLQVQNSFLKDFIGGIKSSVDDAQSAVKAQKQEVANAKSAVNKAKALAPDDATVAKLDGLSDAILSAGSASSTRYDGILDQLKSLSDVPSKCLLRVRT